MKERRGEVEQGLYLAEAYGWAGDTLAPTIKKAPKAHERLVIARSNLPRGLSRSSCQISRQNNHSVLQGIFFILVVSADYWRFIVTTPYFSQCALRIQVYIRYIPLNCIYTY